MTAPRSRRRVLLFRLLAAGLAGGLALLVVEVALRIFPLPVTYMTMRSVVQQVCTRPHPTIQYVNREGYRGTFANREFRTEIAINNRGLRDREYPYDRTAGKPRILVLGDSFPFGWGVEQNEAVSERLEQRLADRRGPVDVINAACSGWNTRQELQWLEEEGLRYRADTVLLFFCENDPGTNADRFRFEAGRLGRADDPRGSFAELKRWLVRHSAVWVLLRHGLQSLRGGDAPTGDPRPLWDEEARLLAALKAHCEARQARLAVVYAPDRDAHGRPTYGLWFGRLRRWCAARMVPFLDPVPALEIARKGGPVYFRLDDHWTARGHDAVAEASVDFLSRPGPLRGEIHAGPGRADR